MLGEYYPASTEHLHAQWQRSVDEANREGARRWRGQRKHDEPVRTKPRTEANKQMMTHWGTKKGAPRRATHTMTNLLLAFGNLLEHTAGAVVINKIANRQRSGEQHEDHAQRKVERSLRGVGEEQAANLCTGRKSDKQMVSLITRTMASRTVESCIKTNAVEQKRSDEGSDHRRKATPINLPIGRKGWRAR